MNIGSLGPPLKGAEPAAGRPGVLSKQSSKENEFGQTLAKQDNRDSKETGQSSENKLEKPGVKESSQSSQKLLRVGSEPETQKQEVVEEIGIDPVQKFMASVESEFGIPPTRLVGAMGKLPEEELKSAPEDSLEPLMQQLGLTDQQKPGFKAKYLEMVADWQAKEPPAETGIERESLAAASVMSQAPSLVQKAPVDRRELLNHSLDRMNQQFFMKGDFEKAAVLQNSQGLNQQELSPEVSAAIEQELARLPQSTEPMTLEGLEDGLKVATAAAGATAAVASPKANIPLGGLGEDMTEGLDLTSMTEPLEGMAQENSQGEDMLSQGEDQASMQMKADSPDLFVQADGESFDQEVQGQLSQGLQGVTPKEPTQSTQSVAPLGTAAAFMGDEESAAKNVSNMIEQARFIAKEGGGDMKVRLTPEGLGQVDLQVSVKDGQVTVAMMADTAEARELLERHKDGLKAGLLENKISVSEIKIGSSQQLGQEDFGQTGHDREESQELAKQFMQEFRHQNQRNRSSNFDLPSFKGYGRPAYKDGLSPMAQGVSSTARSNEGGRIHVVA